MNSPWRRNGSKRNSNSEEEKLGEKCLYPEQKLRSSQQSSDHCNLAPKIARNFVAEFSPDMNELEKEREGNRPCVSVMDEKISKDQSKRKLPEQTRKRWRKAAVCVTVICTFVSLSLTIASFKRRLVLTIVRQPLPWHSTQETLCSALLFYFGGLKAQRTEGLVARGKGYLV